MLSSESFRLAMSPGNSQETLSQTIPTHLCNDFGNGNEQPLLSDDLRHLNCFRITSLVPESKDLSQSSDSINIDSAKIDYSTTVQRSSSLRSCKSQHQDTPRIKKIVRFADTLGLDLADIRTYFDDINFFEFDLDKTHEINEEQTELKVSVTAIPTKILIPLFQQPGGFSEFSHLVLERNVMLESAIVSDPICLSVQGIVRVRNLSYNKSVFVRYTMNSWRTMSDLKCLYLSGTCDGFTDKFSFVIYAHCLEPGQRLEFAICFQSENGHYWDNNRTNNYIFQCLPSSPNSSHYSSIITSEDKWNGGSFY